MLKPQKLATPKLGTNLSTVKNTTPDPKRPQAPTIKAKSIRPTPPPSSAAPAAGGSALNVLPVASFPSDATDPATVAAPDDGTTSFRKGGMVRRGWGKARG